VTALRHAVLAVAVLGACTGDAETTPDAGLPEPHLGAVDVSAAELDGTAPSICDLLPDEGLCALACDPDALAEHVPDGACAVFACPLSDGRTFTLHVCAPG